MKLTELQAKNIVKQVMEVIPYNINIMNESGIIIGSGDDNRLDKPHIGAIEALEKRQAIEVYYGTKDVKPGINIPIFFQERPIGVIGITGCPDVVRPFGELVRIMAELLVNQDYILNQQNIKKQQIEEFLYELAYKSNPYSKKFIERGLFLGIDILIPRVAIVINIKKEYKDKVANRITFMLNNTEYYLTIDPETIVLFMEYRGKPIERLQTFMNKNKDLGISFGIGRYQEVLANSFGEAIKAISIGRKIEPEKSIHRYEDLYLFSILSKFAEDKKFIKLNQQLKKGNQADLLNTLITYIKMNGEMNKVAETLHIHRNTLNYRLEKIKELTGKEPRNYKDLLELFIAYLITEL